MCSSVLQCDAVWCSVMQCDAVWCSVMQCVAVCCSHTAIMSHAQFVEHIFRNPLYSIKRALHPTGWRRPIGCLKLQVIFHKRAPNYRALLQKMTYKDKASYRSSPPRIKRALYSSKKTCMSTAAMLRSWSIFSKNRFHTSTVFDLKNSVFDQGVVS